MKSALFILAFSFASFAQTVDVNEVSTEENDSTTIEITKGKKQDTKGWEVVEGAVPVSGEPKAMNKEARKSWSEACTEWKKEFREDNKENHVISVSCGTPECSGSVGQKSCTSTANYKIKTKIQD